MPSIKTDVEVDFEVYCGNCGKGVCFYTEVKDEVLTVSCPDCKDKIYKLKDSNKQLRKQLKDLRLNIKKTQRK